MRTIILTFAATLLTAAPAHALDIITRAQWGARPPVAAMKSQKPNRITVHHTAVRSNPKISIENKLRGLQSFSQSRAKLADGRAKQRWADIPYHYYIAIDGKAAEARSAGFVGDTNTRYDPTGHITIAVEGNFEKEVPTPAELASLRTLIADLAKQYRVPASRIGVHKDYARTACPGRNLEGEVRKIAAELGAAPEAP